MTVISFAATRLRRRDPAFEPFTHSYSVKYMHDEKDQVPSIDPEEGFRLIHAELHGLARAAMSHERRDHTLQPTALVNEAYLRLTRDRPSSWNSRAHFFSAAARAMRQILVDHARTHNAQKRGSGCAKIGLADVDGFYESNPDLLLALDAVLDRLRDLDPRAAHIVELRYFTGLSVDETAELLAVSAKTVKRDWEFARVWLEQQLRPLQKSVPG